MNELSEITKAYIAGFFDGEGCISILKTKANGRNRSPRYTLVAVMVQKSDIPMGELYEEIGLGSIHMQRSNRTDNSYLYHWQISSQGAATFLKCILPYLRSKKREAEIAIEFQATQKQGGNNGRHRLPPEVLEQREHYYQLLHSLKI